MTCLPFFITGPGNINFIFETVKISVIYLESLYELGIAVCHSGSP